MKREDKKHKKRREKKKMHYKVRNNKGEYFVDWVEKAPIFNKEIMMGQRLSETGAASLIKLLSDKNICDCLAVPVSYTFKHEN